MATGGGGGGGVEPPISGEGWDISTAVFSQSFSVSSQETAPTGVFFKPDGLKMYVIGVDNDRVHEYDLSVAWDISTASHVQSFSVSSQETSPYGVLLKPDGLKMYVIGADNDRVHEYDLSTAWDIYTATYLQNFSVASQETNPLGVFFKPDGLKVYVIGFTGDDVNEYDLSTAWDISTATYLQNFSVSSQVTFPVGVFFKPDGLKMYVLGADNDLVHEYDLSTAWDIYTATYLQNFSVSSQVTFPVGVFFKPDGLKMYVIGPGGASIHEYNLSPV